MYNIYIYIYICIIIKFLISENLKFSLAPTNLSSFGYDMKTFISRWVGETTGTD